MTGFADLWIQYHSTWTVHKKKLIPAELAFSRGLSYTTRNVFLLPEMYVEGEFLSYFESQSLYCQSPAAK